MPEIKLRLRDRNEKSQFRLYDIYRYAATGVESRIRGIYSYEVNRDATVISICFGDAKTSKFYFPRDEKELKAIVKEVNRRLGNCDKPGPKMCRRK